jgi:hypothetical protein
MSGSDDGDVVIAGMLADASMVRVAVGEVAVTPGMSWK